MLHFETIYLYRVYSMEPGHETVKALLAGSDKIATAWHGRAEFADFLLRKQREGSDTIEHLDALNAQFQKDCETGLIVLLPLQEAVMLSLETTLRIAPAKTNIRAADALHLACADEHGFTRVHSNDRHFLNAAGLFGLEGLNVISI